MTRPTLLLLHGWGFDTRLWDRLAEALAAFRTVRWDRGYFGDRAEPEIEAPFAAIGHSLGAMLLAERLPAATPLVAINGFDRFTGEGAVAPRIVERMRARFAEAPDAVLTDFRRRCGAPPGSSNVQRERLAEDLAILATHRIATSPRRILTLQGGCDPILPVTLRNNAFPAAERATHPQGGHLLPATHPGWCAEQIEGFLCR
jgi:pimeloyl-[acyl-carrier protein] methyl ester esterase